jgi:oxygen-independent coproporphyrinogen-3 oxidase
MIEKSDIFGGIYVHIPYCVRKCPYCDFYSRVDLSSVPVFLEALEREAELAGGVDQTFDTLYIGGGTPSVLEPEALARIIETIHRHFNIRSDVETTLEVNPGTVSKDSLAKYHRAGINRLNIGVQSFHDENLEFLGRIHSVDEAISSIQWARQAGFDNIGLDLIYGLPGQNKENWLRELDLALEADVEHFSCYMLTFESGTLLMQKVNSGRIVMPDSGTVRELFDTTIDFWATHGFLQYEISNFAKQAESGPEVWYSRHNQKYWSFAPYIGLGPSAHSFIAPERYWNHRNLENYVRQIKAGQLPIAGKETLTREQMILEAIYLGLRTNQGIDLNKFEMMFDIGFLQTFKAKIAELTKDQLLKVTHSHCALTPKGMAYLDSIAAMLTGQDLPDERRQMTEI